jgi:hypothetical protein
MMCSEGDFGSKIDQITHPGNQNQLQRAATSFLAGETVGFCLNAPAGPYSNLAEELLSSVKRCRIVKDRIRLWKEGVRDLVMELCCALHNFRVRLAPWQPMV